MAERRIRPVRLRSAEDAGTTPVCDYDPVLDRLYRARGITEASQLDYSLARLLPVGSLAGLAEAVELLLEYRDRRITIVGDFDADGATSTALVIRCLREFGFPDVDFLVPDRFRFGYGLTPEIVRVAAERAPALLVTVDNGVSSVSGVEEAHRLGMKVLVTDHHLPGSVLPEADAMVNPNVAGNGFASPHLAGVGVAFYLMAALGRRLQDDGSRNAARVPARFLDIVALGTVADVVRLDHNNRILVDQGLVRIRAGDCIAGIRALFDISGRKVARAASSDLGFAVAPRLNAAGRLEDMSIGIECLVTDDQRRAGVLAAALDGINRERKHIEGNMRRDAFAFVDAMDHGQLPACICLYDRNWHQGIVGLVAARVRERFDRPAIAFARTDRGTGLKGSVRSVPGVHARDLLEAIATATEGLVARFGGHAMAAGLTIDEAAFPRFSDQASRTLKRMYPDADFSGALVSDGPLSGTELTLEFARRLRAAGPWGSGFPEPVFHGEFIVEEQRTVGDDHLKMRVRAIDGGPLIDAIAFGQAGVNTRGVVQFAYRLDVNEYRGVETPQLVVEQIVNNAASA